MKIQTIHDVLRAAGLEPLSKAQLVAIAQSPLGKKFEAALLAFGAGQAPARQLLSLVSTAHMPAIRSKLRAMGFEFDQVQIATLLLDHGQSVITMIDRAMTDPRERQFFLAFMAGLGFQPTPEGTDPNAPPYYSFKIFGQSAALTISEAQTRKTNLFTVQVDGARGLTAAGRTTYDWQSKLVFQLSPAEMYQLLAVLERKLPAVKFTGHGPAHDKFMDCKMQDGGFFVRMGQTGRPIIPVPIVPADAVRIISLVYKQIAANDTHLCASDLQQLISSMASMMSTSTST